jgi:hypothetical protein
MEHDEALLDSLATLRAAHDKATRLMAELAATGARALKGNGSLPSLTQLQNYAHALSLAQRHVAHCEDLLLGGRSASRVGEVAGARPLVH